MCIIYGCSMGTYGNRIRTVDLRGIVIGIYNKYKFLRNLYLINQFSDKKSVLNKKISNTLPLMTLPNPGFAFS